MNTLNCSGSWKMLFHTQLAVLSAISLGLAGFISPIALAGQTEGSQPDAGLNVFAWGRNTQGQLGDGTTTHRTTPIHVIALADAMAISAGGSYSLVLKSDRTVWASGENAEGQLGDGTTTQRTTPELLT